MKLLSYMVTENLVFECLLEKHCASAGSFEDLKYKLSAAVMDWILCLKR